MKKVISLVMLMLLVGSILAITRAENDLMVTLPIKITSNSEFTRENAVVGGFGTAEDPYLIENWEIDANGYQDGIYIGNTDAHFIIRDCKVYGAGRHGVYFDNVKNGKIDSCEISDNAADGIHSFDSSQVKISGNVISNNGANGVQLDNKSWGNEISKNTISSNNRGILLQRSTMNTFEDNVLSDNIYGIDISVGDEIDSTELESYYDNSITDSNTLNGKKVYYFYKMRHYTIENLDTTHLTVAWSSDITIRNNTVSDSDGVRLIHLDESRIVDNTVSGNNRSGIHFDYSGNNEISGNKISGNEEYGIYFESSSGNHMSGNTVSKNKGDGIHFENSSDNDIFAENTVSENEKSGITFHGSSNNEVFRNNVSKNSIDGIHLSSSSNNQLFRNIISNNDADGIHLDSSSINNRVSLNTVVWNEDNGIHLYNSSHNEVYVNMVSNNKNGITLDGSSNNIISGNKIDKNSEEGIKSTDTSLNNLIYHNWLLDNAGNAYDSGSNQWDNGSEGNYWSDYEERYPDANPKDGIWDTPYEIPGGDNVDRYPLVEPWEGEE